MHRFAGKLHVSDQFVPAPVHIVVERHFGIITVIYDRFGKLLRVISGMNGESRYDFAFLNPVQIDRFLKNKEIPDNNAPARDNDLFSGIPE